MRAWSRGVAALVLIATSLTGLAVAEVVNAPEAGAIQATGGSARFKAIEWISWGSVAGEQISNSGKTVTETSTIAGQTLAVTCSVKNLARTAGSGSGSMLEAYRPGSWRGDGFDELYNRGGTGSANQMIVGLSNRLSANTIEFDFNCSATLGGAPFPLSGLVMADAESSGGDVERVGATIPRTNPANGLPTTWRILDRIRGASCTLTATARRTETGTLASGTNRLEMYGPASNTCENNAAEYPGPSAIAFMENATSATKVTVAGGGKSAIALGVALDFDFGDAPLSYGEAVAGTQFSYVGGEVPLTTLPFSSTQRGTNLQTLSLATLSAPSPRIGANTDGELSQPYGAGADGDDALPAAGPDDEDAISPLGTQVLTPGQTFTVDVACTRNAAVGGQVAGWIDWNLNGSFDAGERSGIVACPAGGTVQLSWTVPNDVLSSGGTKTTYLRVRIAADTESLNPTGLTNTGEVEDHRFQIVTSPRLEVVKQVGQRVDASDQFQIGATGPGVNLTAVTSGAGVSASTGSALVPAGVGYQLTDAMAPGSPNQLSDYRPTITCVDRAANDAPVATSGAVGNWTLANLGNGQHVRCVITNTAKPADLDVEKTAGTVSAVAPDGSYTVDYQVRVRNTGPQGTSYTLTDSPDFAPNLAVLGATWTTSGVGVGAGGTATGAGPFVLADGQSIARGGEHLYAVSVRFRYRNATQATACGPAGSGLFNRAVLAPGQETGSGANNTACVAPPAPPVAKLLFSKDVAGIDDLDGNGTDAGDRIRFSFTLTNDGPVIVDQLAVDDPQVSGLTCLATTLAPGAVTTCSAYRTLTQNDVDSGAVNNTATVSGKDPIGTTVTSPPDSTSTPLTLAETLVLDKRAAAPRDANGSGRLDAGDTIAFSFLVTNTGASTVRNVRIVDPKVGAVTCSPTTLGPGESATCTAAPYLITQADVNLGSVDNVAIARGENPGNITVSSSPDDTSTPIPALPGLELLKEASLPIDVNGSGLTDAGDAVEYTFNVTNTGNVPLSAIAIDDPLLSAQAGLTISCPAGALAPGATVVCSTSASYRITEADEAAGAVLNSATGRGTPPSGPEVESPPSTTTTVVSTPKPELVLDKRVERIEDRNNSQITDVGDAVIYAFTITNTGNVPVTSVAVVDPKLSGLACVAASLAPGASTTCSADPYLITSADLAAGAAVNVAAARGSDPDGVPVTSPPDTTSTPTTTPRQGLSIKKSAAAPVDVNNSGVSDAGDTIAYTFTVTNTGNVPLTAVRVIDPLLDGLAITCAATSLAPGATTQCTAPPYVITTADAERGGVHNSAHAQGTDPDDGSVTSPPDTTDTPVERAAPALLIEKSVVATTDVNGSGITDAGDTIEWRFKVTNTGNVWVRAIEVLDPTLSDAGITITCPAGRLAPGDSLLCTAAAAYVITAADERSGAVANTARARGTDPDNATVLSPPDTTSTPVTTPTPKLQIEKSAGAPVDVNGSGNPDRGDTINYTFTVTNTGNVPVTGVRVEDPTLTAAGIEVDCTPLVLAPGEVAHCVAEAPLSITAANSSPEAIVNTATAHGVDPDNDPVVSDPDTVTTPLVAPQPALLLVKRAGTPVDQNGSGITDAGDTISYTFTVTNTGNVTLRGLTINDPLLTSQPGMQVVCDVTVLPAGQSTECRTSAATPYRVTAADEEAGKVANRATATATDPNGDPVLSPPDTTSTPVTTPAPALAIDKRVRSVVDTNANSITDIGDQVTYDFVVTNTGNVPVVGLAIDDPRAPGAVCVPGNLAPGASVTCGPITVTINATDQAAGALVNTATASGDDPDGDPVTSPPDVTSTPITRPQPNLVLDKQVVPGSWNDANNSGITDAGDTLRYRFVIRNAGNVPLQNIDIVDAKLEVGGVNISCPGSRLEPLQSMTCGDTTYTVTAADVAAGAVVNGATVRGTPPGGTVVESPPDITSVPTTVPRPSLTLSKVADAPTIDDGANPTLTDAGDTIRYRFSVRNSGNVPLRAVKIRDDRLGPTAISCDADTSDDAPGVQPLTLQPGQVADCWLTPESLGEYTITQADMDAAVVVNVATASGVEPDGGTVLSPPDDATTQLTSAPALVTVKSGWLPTDVNGSGLTDAGDTVRYQFEVTNTGNVTLEDLSVDDPMLTALGIGVVCEFPGANQLPPGDSVRCVADQDYTITEADEQAKHVSNVATVHATTSIPPQVPIESPPSTTHVPVDRPDPKLTIVKTAGTPRDLNESGLTDAGDTLHFSFTVTNVGNVPVRQIVVDDPMLAGLAITCDLTALTVTGPGASTECRTEEPYVVTAADVASGAVANSATATGRDPDGGPVRSPEDTTSTPTTLPQPSLTLNKSTGTYTDVNGSGLVDAGDTLDYHFVVRNVGNVPIRAVTLSDPKLTAAGIEIVCSLNCAGPLAPGDEREFTAQGYRITAQDVADGAVANRATATGEDPDGGTVTTPPSVTTTPTTLPQPGIALDKNVLDVVDSNGSGLTDAGDRIIYEFLIRNTGNVPIQDLRIDDRALTAAGIAITCDAATLAVGDEVICRVDADYVVTESDEEAGAVANTATAHGSDPDRRPVVSAPDSTAVPTTIPAPALKVEKSVSAVRDLNNSGLTDADDEIVYTFAVTNTGNVPVFDLAIDDPLLEGLAITCIASWINPGDAPVICTSEPYVVTEADEAAGSVANRATAGGNDPDGDPVTSPPDTTSTPTTRPQPGLTIEKTASAPDDVNDSGLTDAGDEITYSFTVTNTGNVPLTGVAVVDAKLAAQGITITCLPARLLPTEVADCTASAPYRVSAADVTDRSVANSAIATATDPDGDPVKSPPDTTATPTTRPAPSLRIEKVARTPVDRNGSGITDAGDRIVFTFTVTNTGNVPIDDVVLDDEMLSDAGVAVTCVVGCTWRLEPGAQSEYVSTPYPVTAADVARGAVVNTATASGEDPDGGPVTSPPDTTSTPTTVPAPELELDKTVASIDDVNGNGRTDAGDLVHFGFTVTNVGNVPIVEIAVDDPMLGTVTCALDALAPGASTTCTAAPYEITFDDADEGSVINRADVTGTDPDDNPLPPTGDTEVVEIDRIVELVLDKTAADPVDANGNGRIGAGDEISYSFTITNTGTVTVNDVAIDDPLLGAVTCAVTSLRAGESTTCTAAPHTITEKEMVSGAVNNHAVATGTGVGGGRHPELPVTSNRDQTTTPLVAVSRLALVKEADLRDRNGNGLADLGEVIRYRFTITNTGTLRINKVRVVDPMLAEAGVQIDCVARSLEPGESTTCSADYTVRASDLGDEPLVNIAHAAGDTTRSPVSSADDAAEVRTAGESALPDAGGFARGWLGFGAVLLGAGIVLLVGTRRRIRRGES